MFDWRSKHEARRESGHPTGLVTVARAACPASLRLPGAAGRLWGLRALLALAVLGWALRAASELWSAPGYDLSALVVGAKIVADGHVEHLYDHNARYYNRADSLEFTRAAARLGFGGSAPTAFVHPPLVAAAAAPLTWTPFSAVAHAWLIASLIATAFAIALAFRLYLPRAATPGRLALVFALLGFFEPVRYGLWLGQTTPFVLAAVVGSLALLRRRKPMAAGLLLALPVFLKLTPAVLAAVWLWQRRGRALLGLISGVAVLAALSLAVVGVEANLTYARRVAQIGTITLVAFNNHSLAGFLTRLSLDHPDVGAFEMIAPPVWVRCAVLGSATAVAILALLTTRPGGRASGPLLEGLAMVTMLLVPSIAWTHYFVFLLPAALAACASVGPRRRVLVGALGTALLALCSRPILTDQAAFDTAHRGFVETPTHAALGMLLLLAAIAAVRRFAL